MRLKNLPISVDSLIPEKDIYCYFITSYRSKSIKGITKNWNHGIIYCTQITAKLITENYEIENKRVIGLDLNTPHMISIGANTESTITVIPIRSHNIIGSCMFLFQSKEGNILYTGNFRFDNFEIYDEKSFNLLSKYKKNISTLYIDNTYCNPKFKQKFPSKNQSSQLIQSICQSHSQNIFVFTFAYNLGIEDILIQLSEAFHSKIFVPKEIIHLLQIIDKSNFNEFQLSNYFTSQKNVKFLLFSSYKFDFEKTQKTIGNDFITIHIMEPKQNTFANPNNTKEYFVQISFHPSYSEIENFLHFIEPRDIKPIYIDSPFEFSETTLDYLFPKDTEEFKNLRLQLQGLSVNEPINYSSNSKNFPKLRSPKKRGKGAKFIDSSDSSNENNQDNQDNL
ncbi:protein artemis [Anaeramoeba ignava]|uniref:Protein artemis n=1 Tax=Anaeramoeba ignava TaxID=1746090 RepID=A0A9Q0LCS0_ANAIG|nr:protein artemis [Anaeramoeba ignava]